MRTMAAILLILSFISSQASTQTLTEEEYREYQRQAASGPCFSEEECRTKRDLREYNKLIDAMSQQQKYDLNCGHFPEDCRPPLNQQEYFGGNN